MSDAAASDAIEQPKDTRAGDDPRAVVAYWLEEWKAAGKAEEAWRKSAGEVVKKYRDAERKAADGTRMNILYSNVQTLAPALYSATPKPDVRRRYSDPDPAAKVVSTILERAISYSLDQYDFDGVMDDVVMDTLLTGRGTPWVTYEPVFGEVPGPDGQPMRAVVSQKVFGECVFWEDFRVSPARRWKDARWVGRKLSMTRQQLEERFGDAGKSVRLDQDTKAGRDDSMDRPDDEDPFKRGSVYQIWDKTSRRLIHVSPSFPDAPLEEAEDPLKLSGFFPCPPPLYGVQTTDSLVPVPEYLLYEDQAEELNAVTERITALVDMIKIRGACDGDTPELAEILKKPDGSLVQVENWAALAEKGGLASVMGLIDVSPHAAVVAQLYQHRTALIQTIYELTGVSDVLRGSSDPRETATAQSIKAKFGGLRLTKRQMAVQRLVRDIFRIKAEIIAEHFEPHVLTAMTGIEVTPEIVQLLREETARSFRIDVETDSTVAQDYADDQQALVGLISGLTQMWQTWGAMVQQSGGVIPLEVPKALSGAVARRAKLGRVVEDALDQIQAQPQPQQGQQQPDPAAMKAQAEMQKLQAETQAAMTKAQIEQQIMQARAQAEQQKAAIEQQVAQAELAVRQQELALKREEIALQMELQRARHAMEMEKLRAASLPMGGLNAMPPPPGIGIA